MNRDMTDNEYIKAAVELADGWEWKGDLKALDCDSYPFIKTSFGLLSVSLPKFHKHPAYADALAAQLVRQVDAVVKDWRCLELFPGHTAIREFELLSYEGKDVAACFGKGRTMNTIKTIVDSRVLK